MGAHASLQLAKVHEHVRLVLSVELLCAAQGLDLRAPLQPGGGLAAGHAHLRRVVSAMMTDRPIAPDINAVRAMLDDGSLLAAVESGLGDALE